LVGNYRSVKKLRAISSTVEKFREYHGGAKTMRTKCHGKWQLPIRQIKANDIPMEESRQLHIRQDDANDLLQEERA